MKKHKLKKIFVIVNVKLVPVINYQPLHFLIVDFKSERLYKMKRGAGCGACAGDIARVLRDFRLDENYIYQKNHFFRKIFLIII